MLKSMTGYGTSTAETESHTYTVEVRTLNSKSQDITIRLPRTFSDKELAIRTVAGNALERGKITISVEAERKRGTIQTQAEVIDTDQIRFRFNRLKEIAGELGVTLSPLDTFRMAYQWPATGQKNIEELQPASVEEDTTVTGWPELNQAIEQALAQADSYRKNEGAVLQAKLLEYNQTISSNLARITELEPARVPKLRARLEEKLHDFLANGHLEQGRLEQEMIFHAERLDIAEEIVRLSNHIAYFKETIDTDPSAGRKLGFISQEMGREINTIGSKANDAELQQIVVAMKEDLERIKEQAANIL
jgi:uncharacterized protein (TIGR00255 family)